MDQTYFERVTRQTHVRRLLQKAVLNLCQKNYAACASNLEVDGIICISFPDSPDQHVVKIHEKVQLDNVKPALSCERFMGQNEAFVQVHRLPGKDNLFSCNQNNRNETNRILEDRDSMKNSYLDEADATKVYQDSFRNPVFPRLIPSAASSNKRLDSDCNSSKSKRKMFKVVQRKRNISEEPDIFSNSSNECSNLNTSEHQSQDLKLYEDSPCQEEEQIVSPEPKKNFSESVQDGYVIVKVENFDDEDGDSDNKLNVNISGGLNENSRAYETEQEPPRNWIQLPPQEDSDSSLSPFKYKPRESLITIDGKVTGHSERNECYNEEIHKDKIPTSVKEISISKEYHDNHVKRGDREFETSEFDTRDISVKLSAQIPKRIENSQLQHPSSIMKSLLHKNKPLLSKGGNVLDNLFLTKCADVKTNLQQKTMSNPQPSSDQPKKHVSMIDLQSTSTTASDIKRPACYNIAINTVEPDSIKEKKYFCRHCGKGFTLKCTRSRHEKTICGGGGEGQYRCHICSKVFTRSDSRCRHLWKTHGVKSASEITSMC